MNAKKIMGAVLVALLAAALFVGAGSAATDDKYYGTVFVYQLNNGLADGVWTSGDNSIQIKGGEIVQTNVVAGTYKNDTGYIIVKYPTATISGVAEVDNTNPAVKYSIIDSTYYLGDDLTVTATSDSTATLTVNEIAVKYPDGSVKNMQPDAFESVAKGKTLPLGKYEITAKFTNSGEFNPAMPANYLNSQVTYTFTVANSADVTISASTETVIESNAFSVVVTGKPGSEQTVTADDKFTFVSVDGNTPTLVTGTNAIKVTIPNTGKVTVYMAAKTDTGNGKVKVGSKDVTITVVAGSITAKAEKDSYFIGDNIKLTGTSTAGSSLWVYIAGNNIPLTYVDEPIAVESDNTWKITLATSDLTSAVGKKLDAGTYTIYISNKQDTTTPTLAEIKSYTTVSLALKQPFISITDAPSVAVKGTEYVITGTAEATEGVKVYIFGTNYFAANGNIGDKLDMSVSFDKNVFTIEVDIPEGSSNMSTGQYFMVVQHPMYDGKFNIWADNTNGILLAPTVKTAAGAELDMNNVTTLFDVNERQNTNAAQALCDNLDSQNIDDMYVKLSFIVANAESTINPIPSEITKGSKLTVSGSTNMGEGKLVTVEMVASAFAALPKEEVGSASFIALTAETDKNGNWEVTFDTTGLINGEYLVTAAVEQMGEKSVKVNVIEGAPTEQPTETPTTQPTQTEQPTETPVQTPGFGALAALAGLGAVAVLLLRRE